MSICPFGIIEYLSFSLTLHTNMFVYLLAWVYREWHVEEAYMTTFLVTLTQSHLLSKMAMQY